MTWLVGGLGRDDMAGDERSQFSFSPMCRGSETRVNVSILFGAVCGPFRAIDARWVIFRAMS